MKVQVTSGDTEEIDLFTVMIEHSVKILWAIGSNTLKTPQEPSGGTGMKKAATGEWALLKEVLGFYSHLISTQEKMTKQTIEEEAKLF